MKAIHVRAVAALATCLALSACGGKATFDVSGTVTGLTIDSLVLVNESNNDTVTVQAGAAGFTGFTFPKQASYGDNYAIAIKKQPRHLECAVALPGSFGSAGHTATISASVTCQPVVHSIGGTVIGLTGGGVDDKLVLANGSAGTASISMGSTSFVFPEPVADGQAYGVTVLTQPPGLFCTVANGTSIMGEANRADIVVTCGK